MSINSLAEEQQMANAKAMGDGFADQRALELMKFFLCETGIVDDEYSRYKEYTANSTNNETIEPARFLEVLAKDYIVPFKRIISTCYGIGFMDAKQNVITSVYSPSPAKIERGGLIL